ncbi:MAG TPA: hypothetical protein VF516_14045 [Kofleriaceae bacterium]
MNAGQFIQWQDLFAIVDDGSIPISRYGVIETAMREQAKTYPQGIAVLVILPPDARPPPEEVRTTVKNVLMRLVSSLSCLTYVVEGTGFKGVAARATLVGMKIFASRPYPIYVETSVREALAKITSHMTNGHAVSTEVILKAISEARLVWQAPSQARNVDHELTLK